MKTSGKFRTILLSVVIAASFAIAGCGGGGGTTDTSDPGTTPPSPDPPLVAAQKAAATAASNANQSYMDAMAAVVAVEDIKDSDMASYEAAMAAAGLAKTASESAASLSQMAAGTDSAADAQTYAAQAQLREMDAADALADSMMYAGMVTAAKTAADNKAERLAANAVAKTKEDAISDEAGQTATNDGGLGGSQSDGSPVTTYSMTISRDRMGTTVKITDTALAGDDDPKFMQAMDLGSGTTMHARAMAADDDGNVMDEVVIIRTDIEAPTAVEFEKFENADGTTPQVLNVSTDTTNDTPTATNEALGIVAGNLGMVKASAFTAPAGTVGTTTLNFQQAVADTPGTPADESRDAAEIAGTFNGSMGTYKCVATGAACTVTVNAMGVVSDVSDDDDWAFIPAMGATTDQPDYDYLHYGFWLKRTTKDGAVTSYNEVETFAGSSVNASGDISDVEGTATYEGGAVGVYVKNVYNSDRTIDTASSGHFSADVSLMAYFGGNDVAANKQNTIEGTIDNFMLSGGEENSWSVALKSSAASDDGTHAGTAKGGDGDGSFSAAFHGPVADANNNPIQPHSVVGEFNAGFTDGSVAGGFGARKMME